MAQGDDPHGGGEIASGSRFMVAGAPLCPIEDHGQMQHEPLDDDSEDEGGEDS
nr:hypothetical protein [Sphingobium baderi]